MARLIINGKIYATKISGVVLLLSFCCLFAAAQPDGKLKLGETVFAEAVKLSNENTIESSQASLPKFIEARKLFDEAGNSKKKNEAAGYLGYILQKLGNEFLNNEEYKQASEYLNQALPFYREINERAKEGELFHNLGYISYLQKEPEKAAVYYEQALSAYRETKNLNGEAIVLRNLGIIYKDRKDYAGAEKIYAQALEVRRQLKNRPDEAILLKYLAEIYEFQRNHEKAALFYLQALTVFRELKNVEEEASILHSLGVEAIHQNKSKEATDYYNQALIAYRKTKNSINEAIILNNLGSVYFDEKDYRRAARHFEQSLLLKKQLGDKSGEASLSVSLGDTFYEEKQYEKAAALYKPALAIWRELKDRDNEADTLNKLGLSFYANYQAAQAISVLDQALAIHRADKNQSAEAETLLMLGRSHALKRNFAEAKSYLSQAAALFQTLKNEWSEGYALLGLGGANYELSEREQAKALYEQSLKIFQKIKDRNGEAYALISLADVDSYFNRHVQAVANIRRARALFQEIKDPYGEFAAYTGLASVSYSLSEYEESLKYNDSALKIAQQLNDSNRQMQSWVSAALVYSALSQYEKALSLEEKALTLARQTGDRYTESIALGNIGYDYFKRDDYEKAEKYISQSIEILREQKALREEGYMLHNLGLVYYKLKKYDQALKLYDQALKIYKEVEDRRPESFLYDSYGEVYTDLGLFEKAAENLEKSLILAREIKYSNVEANALTNLMALWERRKQSRLAAFYGKQAVNVFQTIRGGNRNLDKEAQRSFLKSNEKTYRGLADLLIAQGRLPEAQQILDMLKEEEFYGFVRRDASEVEKLSQRADLTADESEALKRYQSISSRVTEIGLEFGKLQDAKNQLPENGKLPAADEKRFEELAKQLEDATTTFQVFLRGLAEEFTKKPKIVEEIQENTGLQADLKSWGTGIVALYTVVGEDRYRVILTTPDAQIDGKTEISAEDLNRKISEFREAVQDPTIDPRPLGKELYDILIKPIEKQLSDAKAKTLLWSLDGTLRYLPFAALWDGKEYFGQKYENVVITLASRTRLGETVSADWRVLGLGVTDAQAVLEPSGTERINFSALPAVRGELRSIVSDEITKENPNGVLPGVILLNENFTEAAFKERLGKGYKVIHIASHFSFRPGNETKSFLLLGDGQPLSLVKVRTSPQLKFKGVELLTLSACQTAVGETNATGREIESFGEIAQQNGAKAVLATLWSVADESTRILMSEFYRIRSENPKMTKTEAMRQAQLKLLNGKHATAEATKKRSDLIDLSGKSKQQAFKTDVNAPFAHPYYWSPFILFGNWR